ncbi:MAG: tetratricopeptide repeat protein [Candidatus Heimdallarchaeota archaeon]|nr:tetratricopeptide repeat protein [Candidatus Heimdallarchaeota archaeon]
MSRVFYCLLCEKSHSDLREHTKCTYCGRIFCNESLEAARSVGRENCPYCDKPIVLPSSRKKLIEKGGFSLITNKDKDALIDEGDGLFNQDFDEALSDGSDLSSLYEALFAEKKPVEVWVIKGENLNRLGKYDEALQACDQAIAIDSKNSSAWRSKGISLFSLSKYDEALQAVDQAIALASDNIASHMAWHTKSKMLSDLGNHGEAVKALKQAIRLVTK